jgi:hypothetical protein
VTESWEAFSAALAEELSGLEAGAVLFVVHADHPTRGRRAQFGQAPDHLLADVSTSDHAPDVPRLPAEVERRIATIGWNSPDEKVSGNWWLRLPWPASATGYYDLADKSVAVLRDVFGFDSPAGLRYRGFVSATGEPLVLPGLLIDRVPS